VVRCVHCGSPKIQRVGAETAEMGSFEAWGARQVGALLAAANAGTLVTTSLDVRSHNVAVSSKLPEVGGITHLGLNLRLGRTTTCGWQNNGRRIALGLAVRWAWLIGVDLPVLFSRKLGASELRFTPLPGDLTGPRQGRAARRPSVPEDSAALYLSVLRLSSKNPFLAPTVPELVRETGVHVKHPAFKEPSFLRLLGRLRAKTRRFRKKERLWREFCDIHQAASKVLLTGKRLSRRRVAKEMKCPGSFRGALSQRYLDWFKDRHCGQKKSCPKPMRPPVEIRAYWTLRNQGG
jgi:hypothetical protein